MLTPLFPLGAVEISPAAAALLKKAGIAPEVFLARHQHGDWGEVNEREREANAFAVRAGHTWYAITSRYRLDEGTLLLAITAPDRSCTGLLLTSEHQVRDVSTLEGYEVWARTYDQEKNALIVVEEPRVEALLASLPITSALDVGTGTGRHALRLARRGVEVTAIDQSPAMLAVAQRAAERERLTIHFQCAPIEEGLPCASAQFDLVICTLMLAHVPGLAPAIREFYRVLKPGGFLLITDFHPDVVALGWKGALIRPSITYVLPNAGHTRADYLHALTTAGLTVQEAADVTLGEVPDGYLAESLKVEAGQVNYCLILLAQKPEAK